MNHRIERCFRFRAIDAFQDHGIIAHRPADKAALSWKGWCGTFANHPKVSAAVGLAPSVVVMVVYDVSDVAANDLANALNYPFPAGVGIAARELHCRDVAPPKL